MGMTTIDEIKVSENVLNEINSRKEKDDGFDVYEIQDEFEFAWLQVYCKWQLKRKQQLN